MGIVISGTKLASIRKERLKEAIIEADVRAEKESMAQVVRIAADGEQVTITWENTGARTAPTGSPEPSADGFIGNKRSKIFHDPRCANLPGEKNRVTFDDYDQALAAGYTPCGNCLE